MKINKLITKINRVIGRAGYPINWIVIHYVGATGGAEENCVFFQNVNRSASAHYFVGHKGEVWQCVEDKDTAWHCGGSLQGTRGHKYFGQCLNSNSIGIELCVNKKGGKWVYEDSTLESAAELVQMLMKIYNVPSDHVIRHFDVTGKECPANYLTDTTWKSLHDRLTKTITESNKIPAKSKYIVSKKVGLLQKAINKDCGTKLVIDNSCGPATLEQLKKINIWAYPDKTCRKYPNIMKFVQTQLGGLAVDGSYGPASKAKVKAFQQKYGLVANAVIGINTLKKLCE